MPRPKNAAVAREIYAFAVREKGEIRTVVRIVVSCLAVSALRCNVGAIHCGLLSKMGGASVLHCRMQAYQNKSASEA